MRKYLIILSFFTLPLMGQLSPDIAWEKGYVVIGLDTFLQNRDTDLAITELKITNLSGQEDNINNGFIDMRSDCFINDQPVCSFYPNYDLSDSAFFSLLPISANLPPRIDKIYLYNSPQTGVELSSLLDTFNVPNLVNYNTVCASGCDYASINAAVLATPATDSVIVLSGDYLENSGSNYLNLPNTENIIAVGKVTVTTASTSTGIAVRGANSIIRGLICDSEGTKTNYFSMISTSVGSSIQNCYHTGFTNAAVFRGYSNTEFKGNVFNCDIVPNYVFQTTDNYSVDYIENGFHGRTVNGMIYDFTLNDTATIDIKYNLWDIGYGMDLWVGSSELNFVGNTIISDSLNNRLLAINSNSTNKPVLIKDNDFLINKVGTSFNLINTPQGLHDLAITNNSIITLSGGGFEVNVIEISNYNADILIDSNYLDIINGNSIFIDSMLTGNTLSINNNTIKSRTATSNDQWFTVRVQSLADDVELNFIENEVYNPLYYGQSFGGHACIFAASTLNSKIIRNKAYGAAISSIVYKNDGGNNTAALIQGNETDRILNKGQRKTKIYNNTIFGNSEYSLGIIENQDVGVVDKRSDSCMVYNNIIYNNDTALLINNINGLAANTFSNNNILFANTEVSYNSVNRDLSWWQTNFSQDLNSYNTNPNFKSDSQLWPIQPSDALLIGNTQLSPSEMLDTNSVWPDSVNTIPTGYFVDAGAYKVSPDFTGDTVDWGGEDTRWVNVINKINAGIDYIDQGVPPTVRTDSLPLTVIKINAFIKEFDPIQNDTIIYGTDAFSIWNNKFNAPLKLLTP